MATSERTGSEVALIGMAGRFPGAGDVEQFWSNLVAGRESVRFFEPEQLEAAGVDRRLLAHPDYVRAAAVLDDAEAFDAGFFGYTPREAELTDPQQRVFLECAFEALEQAGYTPARCRGPIGVFAGGRMGTYLLDLYSDPELLAGLDPLQVGIGNDVGLLGVLTAYKLDLTGPAFFVQTACSTALMAVHLARQSLLMGECDLALAGAVAVDWPQDKGYLHRRGGILSADGHTRAFDARASGTLFGNGVGVVVLKRLEQALAERDHIHAVVRGAAANNDGAAKASFTAPGVDGQAQVITAALVDAELASDAIGYVEAHGTATNLGDPVELRALTRAFRAGSTRKGYCALGSVKTNVGHLDAAAGMAGLIKTALALEREQIPPSLHFSAANPEIDFETSPFFVNTALRPWPRGGAPRRAGVSAFGIGGTNCHVVLEEAPPAPRGGPSRPWQLLVLSGRSQAALAASVSRLCDALSRPEPAFPDVCATLQVGRKEFAQRLALVCRSAEDAARALHDADPQRLLEGRVASASPPVVFMFPGVGSQHVGMAAELYRHEPTFRAHVDRCAELLRPHLGLDLRHVMHPAPGEAGGAAAQLARLALTQVALFVVEYALAQLWMEWGVKPQGLIGHSLGEYVAACLAGVFSLEDALALVAARGQMMEATPPGVMSAVFVGEDELGRWLGPGLSLVAVNAPTRCVVGGSEAAVAALEARLVAEGVERRRLHATRAAHSSLMEPVLEEFRRRLEGVTLSPPTLPFISNVSGTWITPEQATDPGYWVRHLRQPVRFADGVAELLLEPRRVMLEVGPGHALATLAREQAGRRAETVVVSSLPHPDDTRPDHVALLTALGRLWLEGVDVDWAGFQAHEERCRVALPSYPFERERYLLAPRRGARAGAAAPALRLLKNPDVEAWFHVPVFERAALPAPPDELPEARRPWLVFVDGHGVGAALARRLEQAGEPVVRVSAGRAYARRAERELVIDPARAEDYRRVLSETGLVFRTIVHCWSVAPADPALEPRERFDRVQAQGYTSLLLLGRALAGTGAQEPLTLVVATRGLFDLSGQERCEPEKATLVGPCLVLPQEQQHVTCRCVDVGASEPEQLERVAAQLLAEAVAESSDVFVAWRGARRHVQGYRPAPLPRPGRARRRLREGGVYLLTGGLGNVGLQVAEHLVRLARPTLVFASRSGFPERAQWPAWLAQHGELDATGRRIRRLMAFEQAGARVDVMAGDVADEARTRALVDEVERRHGALHGVVHAAGVLGGRSIYRALGEIGWEESQEQFAPKVYGLYALERALAGRRLDFCLLLSSNAAVLGGLGFVAYAAANAFMDAFAGDRARDPGSPWVSADWDEWPAEPGGAPSAIQTSMSEFAMTPGESGDALERVLTLAEPGQVVVATGDLEGRRRLWVTRVAARPGAEQTLHARPELRTRFVEPRNDSERRIAAVWGELLGLERVGVFDNFFELGGHSLLATRMLSRLRDAFQVEIELRRLFEGATVAQLAEAVLGARLGAADAGDLARLVSEIQGLSEAEVESALADGGKERGA